MQNRTPVARAARAPIPAFEPVPRQYRHDGWTPERQRAFIEALADTGSVTRAAGMVNMSQSNCYVLRRAPGAEGLRRAWDAALNFGVGRLKDIAFERAIEGELVPVFVAGKLMGFRRKRNDALLMFCLRHYGEVGGRRTTVNYFRTEATAGAGAGAGSGRDGAAAAATTMRVSSGDRAAPEALAARDDVSAGALARFEGVTLDPAATAAIAEALTACAARARAAEAAIDGGGDAAADALADDPEASFVRLDERASPYLGTLESGADIEDADGFVPGEPHWRLAGADKPDWVVETEARMAAGPPPPSAPHGPDGVASVRRPKRKRPAAG